MVTKCATKLTSNATFKAEPTLHQLDIKDEAHGLFQAGKIDSSAIINTSSIRVGISA
jgi:hypothetical protein